MEPESSLTLTLPPGATVAEEKEEQQRSCDQSSEEPDIVTPENGPSPVYPTGIRLAPILFALVCAVFLVALDMTIIGTAIPKITDDFNGLNMVSWYGSAYFMTNGGFQPASGKFFKYFPLKPSFLGAIFIFLVGSLICAVSPNSTAFVVGRAFAGLGAAGVTTGAFTIVGFAAEPTVRPGLIGMIGAVYGLSSVLGPILGGVFTDEVTWRWCFYFNLPVGGLSGLIILFFFQTPPQATTTKASWKEKFLQMDLLGVSLVMGGIISFILGVEYGRQTHPWNSSTVIGLLVGSGLIWIAFAIWEYFNNERAMLPRRILRQRFVWMPATFQCFFAASYFVLLYYLPIYFQSIDNRSAIASGVLNLPLVVTMAVGSAISGTVVSKTGHAAPFMVSSAVIATVSAGLMYTYDIGTCMGKWVGYQILYGAACGLGFQMGITIAQANSKMEDLSSATATVFFFQTIGGAFSVSAAQSAFVNRMVTKLGKTAPEVNSQMVIATGATEIRTAFPADQVPAIVVAYMAGIKVKFALVVALIGFTCVLAVFVPRKKLNPEARQGGSLA